MLHKDWMLRQVEMFVTMLAKLVFDKDDPKFDLPEHEKDEQIGVMHRRLADLTETGHLLQAKMLLTEKLDADRMEYLELAIDFYARWNQKTDQELEEGGLTREDLEQGLKDAARLYGINIPGITM